MTIRKIIENLHAHPLKNKKILQSKEFLCTVNYQEKLVIRPSPIEVGIESLRLLLRIQGDICGHIHLPYERFRYFMV